MTIASNLRFLYIFWGSGLECAATAQGFPYIRAKFRPSACAFDSGMELAKNLFDVDGILPQFF